MRYMIERMTGPDCAVAIGTVDADTPDAALVEATACGLAETGDYYRAATVRESIARQIAESNRRAGWNWTPGDIAACGLLACAVRVLADDAGPTVRVRSARGVYDVVRGSLVPTTTGEAN